jgi:hypothetical protein
MRMPHSLGASFPCADQVDTPTHGKVPRAHPNRLPLGRTPPVQPHGENASPQYASTAEMGIPKIR